MIWALFIMTAGVIALLSFFVYRAHQNQNRRFSDKIRASETTESELRETMQVLQEQLQQASLDPVTGLIDRPHFLDRFKLVLKESERYQLTAGLLYFEIDNFKLVNDALSYEVGDQLLEQVARRLEKCIRQVDSITRFSSASFAILVSQLSKPETAAVVAQRILQAIIEPFYIDDQVLYLTACVGIAIFPGDGEDINSLFQAAENALLQAKQTGKHIERFFQDFI